jgi:hypothetical protein
VLCTFDIHDKHLSTNITVLCTFDIHDKHLATNSSVLRTFWTLNKAAGLRTPNPLWRIAEGNGSAKLNICRNTMLCTFDIQDKMFHAKAAKFFYAEFAKK